MRSSVTLVSVSGGRMSERGAGRNREDGQPNSKPVPGVAPGRSAALVEYDDALDVPCSHTRQRVLLHEGNRIQVCDACSRIIGTVDEDK